MDALTPHETRLLPALAEAIALWFPELKGRAFAVSEQSVTKENCPTLPLVTVALMQARSEPSPRSRQDTFEIQDVFTVEFWLEPARYKKANGSETPFWSYYPYEHIRDTLLSNLVRWQAPGGEHIAFRSLSLEADQFAVTLTFGFVATFIWCPDAVDPGEPFTIGFGLCAPKMVCEPDEPVDALTCKPC